jgi:hypothetical protein
MQGTALKAVIVIAWLLAIGLIGVLLPVRTTTGWIVIVMVGLLPTVFVLRLWSRRSQTMSESIQEQLRK